MSYGLVVLGSFKKLSLYRALPFKYDIYPIILQLDTDCLAVTGGTSEVRPASGYTMPPLALRRIPIYRSLALARDFGCWCQIRCYRGFGDSHSGALDFLIL